MQDENYHFKLKISLLGDKGVGKSTFLDTISTDNMGNRLTSEDTDELSLMVSNRKHPCSNANVVRRCNSMMTKSRSRFSTGSCQAR